MPLGVFDLKRVEQTIKVPQERLESRQLRMFSNCSRNTFMSYIDRSAQLASSWTHLKSIPHSLVFICVKFNIASNLTRSIEPVLNCGSLCLTHFFFTQDSICNDCVYSFFCGPCSWCQIRREMKARLHPITLFNNRPA